MIDPHVHCRDGRQAYKTTIREVFELANDQGVETIFDMPNTDPPITHEENVQERLRLVPGNRQGNYFLYMGATADTSQLEEAVRCYNEYPEVIGIKLFAGQSVGDLAVIDEQEQRQVYETLRKLGYTGVLAVHCEKESLLQPEVWNPSRPITHAYARPKEAEIESVRDQVRFVRETGFEGTLHICHISCPEAVDLVDNARANINITAGITPHHLLLDRYILEGPPNQSLLYKMNPPLRSTDDMLHLEFQLRDGKIDWIETDHAPHTREEKLHPPYLSGYPSLTLYRGFLEELRNKGLTPEQIQALTHDNIQRTFQNKLGGN